MVFGSFASLHFETTDYSQENLFSDFLSPIALNDNYTKINSEKFCLDNLSYLYDLYSHIMRQIKDKRKRLNHLLKRFG